MDFKDRWKYNIINFITPKEVWDTIRGLSPVKAPELSGITNKVLKHLLRLSSILIANIFTTSLRLSYFPEIWKKAVIIIIPKPRKDHMLPSNHRLIFLLTFLSKIFKKLILARLKPHFKPRHKQYAFRANHSTTTQLITLVNDSTKNASNREKWRRSF